MKAINKAELCQIIMDMEIESIEIRNPIDETLNVSTNDGQGRSFIPKRSRFVSIIIKGEITKPDIQL